VKTANVAIIGTRFMGKAHSNAWTSAPKFFDLPITPIKKIACDLDAGETTAFAHKWGWETIETDWRKVVEREDVDVVDICAPTFLHRDIAIAAAQNGKNVFCEKPIALTLADAIAMHAEAEKAGVLHYLNHNYRRVPAVAFAKRLIEEGKIGRIYHWRAAYLQDWIADPNFPLTWQLRKESAGAGPHFDLLSHSVDLARYLVGEIRAVSAMMTRFVDRRPLPGAGAGTFKAGSAGTGMGDVTVEDASFMLADFANGALGAFEASRFANGRKNFNTFEIYGSQGSLAFDMQRMNELQFMDGSNPTDDQGFRTILVTNDTHPYAGAWWPPGHIIGYEHTFTHAVSDFLVCLAQGTAIHPNFEDGVKGMQVLEAGLRSASTGQLAMVADTT
jgi:predicted dehydrogenase